MFRHLDYDHIIAAILLIVLVGGVGVFAVSTPSGNAAEAAAIEPELVLPQRPTRSPELIWIWPPTPTPEPPVAAAVKTCDEPFRLAGSLDAEGRNQPLGVRMAMAAIIVIEAANRKMTICELTERTNFLAVWRHAYLNPASWHAKQFKNPSESSRAVARVAMTGQFASLRGGAMHFDGAFRKDEEWHCKPQMLWRGGTTCFYP